MSAPTWNFRRKRPSDTARDPIASEFFADESVVDAARALVRESIQNSLDARNRSSEQPVEIRIRVGVGKDAATRFDVERFFTGVWPHFSATTSGLQNAPDEREQCAFLTIEDFSTSGLEGDHLEWTPKEDRKNAFYAFFRAEAFSEKGGDDRGRWGVGKLVFPRSSRGSVFFGYTVQRSTDKPFLMGRMILRHHHVGGVEYLPDAMFGIRETVHGDPDFVIPCGDARVIADFCRTFGVSRREEPGLSVVVPWLEDEGDFKVEDLTKAIAAEYFLPIQRGELIVSVRSERLTLRLDQAELAQKNQRWTDDAIETLLLLGRFAAKVSPEQLITVAAADQANAPRWPEQALAEVEIVKARALLERGDPLAFEVPLNVQLKSGAAQRSTLRIHLVKSEGAGDVPPVFVRDGITITGARGSKIPGYASLVTIDDGPLATLLGDSENPAHTEWRPNTRGLKQKYKFAKAFLDFVRQSPLHVFSTVFLGEREDDQLALGAFFPDIVSAENPRARGGKDRKHEYGGDNPSPPDLSPRMRRYALGRIDGGFEVARGDVDAARPASIRIVAAYDVRRGNPLQGYERYDFDFGAKDMSINMIGAEVKRAIENEILATVTSDDFRIRVTGFDPNRDVFVRVTIPEADDER